MEGEGPTVTKPDCKEGHDGKESGLDYYDRCMRDAWRRVGGGISEDELRSIRRLTGCPTSGPSWEAALARMGLTNAGLKSASLATPPRDHYCLQYPLESKL